MDFVIVALIIFFALMTVLTKQVVTSSFYFLLTCLSVAACFFQFNIIPLSLILIFSAAFWGITYFLLSTVSPEKVSTSLYKLRKKDIVLLILLLIAVTGLITTFALTLLKEKQGTLLTGDFFEYLQLYYMQNIPFLVLLLILLTGSLGAALYFTTRFSSEKEST